MDLQPTPTRMQPESVQARQRYYLQWLLVKAPQQVARLTTPLLALR